MNHHATAHQLSAYLDGELSATRLESVRSHVDGCESCSRRLEGLRNASELLRGIEARALPPGLDGLVLQRVGLPVRRQTLMEKLEGALKAYAPRQSIVMTFALIVALAAFIHLYSSGTAWRHPSQIRVMPSEVQISEPGTGEKPEARDLGAAVDEMQVGSRRFRRLDGRWVEFGLESAAPDMELSWTSAEGLRLVKDHPGLEALIQEGLPVLLRSRGRVLLLRPAPAVEQR